MQSRTIIRPMRSDEWNAFHQLDINVFVEDDQITEDYFHHRVQKPGFFAMQTTDETLIGYLILGRFTDKIGHLGRIAVEKSRQNQGFGSQLMDFALKWFRKDTAITKIQLYTQVDNKQAQLLYNKFGFHIIGETWHYFIPFNTLTPKNQYFLHLLQPNEHQMVANLFPTSLPLAAIRRIIESDQPMFTLKDSSQQIVGATRFTPSFPGCIPFELLHLHGFDDYVYAFQPLCEPPSEYLRITFHENKELARFCERRGYRLHHKLFRMQLLLQK